MNGLSSLFVFQVFLELKILQLFVLRFLYFRVPCRVFVRFSEEEASGFIRVRSNGTMRIDSVRKISSSRTCKELAIDFNWLVIYRGGNSTIKGRNLINQRPTSVCPRLEKFGNRFHWRKPWRLEVNRKSKVTNNLYSTHSRFDLMLEKFHLLFLF